MNIFRQKPVVWIISLLILLLFIPLLFYLFKPQILSGLSRFSGGSSFQKTSEQKNALTPPNSTLPQIISCPVAKEFCQISKVLELSLPGGKKKYDGLGWNLPDNSTIKAAFDGTFKEQETYGATPSPRLVTLTSKDGKYEARYFFTPINKLSVTEEKTFEKGVTVKSGDVLSFIPGDFLRDYKANLKFIVVEKKTNKILLLKAEDLGKFNLE